MLVLSLYTNNPVIYNHMRNDQITICSNNKAIEGINKYIYNMAINLQLIIIVTAINENNE